MKYFMVFLAVVGFCGCGDEVAELHLYDLAFAPPVGIEVTEVPPEIQTLLWGDAEALLREVIDFRHPVAPVTDEQIRFALEWMIPRICLIEAQKAYYKKYINAGGVAIIGHSSVDNTLFLMARDVVFQMTAKRPEFRELLSPANGHYQVLVDWHDKLREIPEFDAYEEAYPLPHCGTSNISGWHNTYCVSVVYPPDFRNRRHSGVQGMIMETFVHEFAHAIHLWGINALDKDFQDRLQVAYARAIELGTWEGQYAETNEREYWAEGVVMWFYHITDTPELHPYFGEQLQTFPTHEAFAEHDPLLFELLSEWFHPVSFLGRY